MLTWLGWFGQDTWLRFWRVFGRAWSSGQGRQSGSSGTQVDLVSCARLWGSPGLFWIEPRCRQVLTLIDYCFFYQIGELGQYVLLTHNWYFQTCASQCRWLYLGQSSLYMTRLVWCRDVQLSWNRTAWPTFRLCSKGIHAPKTAKARAQS